MPKPPVRSKAEPGSGGEAAPAAVSGIEVGVNLISCVLLVGGLGYALDRWQGWAPWGMLMGGMLGFAAWLRMLWRVIQKA